MIIISSFCYTHSPGYNWCEQNEHALIVFEKCHFMPHFSSSLLGMRDLLHWQGRVQDLRKGGAKPNVCEVRAQNF